MSLPTFVAAPTRETTPRKTVTRTQAAARLQMAPGGVDKLIRAGVLSLPPEGAVVDDLAERAFLRVARGELTVLRTDARGDAYPDEDRRFIGFHVGMTDQEVEDACLRWWRCDPARVLDNELFAVCVATIPVAVFAVSGPVKVKHREGEDQPRHHFDGRLLARMTEGRVVRYDSRAARQLRLLAEQIMGSRVHAASGGPIAYLEPVPVAE